MKTLIMTLCCCLLALNQLAGKTFNRPQTESYIKGVEALNAGNVSEAFKLLNDEITANPDNGYAHCYMALVCNFFGDAKLAFHAVNESLRLIPEADKEYRSFAYYTRGKLLMNAELYPEAETDLTEAIRLTPSDIENYKARATALTQEGKYEEALSDLSHALKIDAHADIFDIMMQLIQANPDPTFFDRVTTVCESSTASR